MRKYSFWPSLLFFSIFFLFFRRMLKKNICRLREYLSSRGATRLFLTHGSYIKLSFSTYWPTYVASNVPYKIPYSDKMTNVRLRFYSTMFCHFIERRYRPSLWVKHKYFTAKKCIFMQFRKKIIKTYPILTLAKEIEKKEKSRIYFRGTFLWRTLYVYNFFKKKGQ